MKTLNEAEFIRLMREEYEARINGYLKESLNISNVEDLIAPGLKVVHKASKIRYTVHSVGRNDAVLVTPEGEKFLVDNEKLQQNYCIE